MRRSPCQRRLGDRLFRFDGKDNFLRRRGNGVRHRGGKEVEFRHSIQIFPPLRTDAVSGLNGMDTNKNNWICSSAAMVNQIFHSVIPIEEQSRKIWRDLWSFFFFNLWW
ncbi:unnamed protein product [Cuscuta campestris]|uniref:Uncharacterized protein n=1 Tax=Cuscuta campestris TaxID=132261 RepID=A0A484NKD9_9ASTE|nr:unnamed protein product [Cuscuta campestris]